jgi:hypothetical protein
MPCLDLAFLVHAQHSGPCGRVEIEPDDVESLVSKRGSLLTLKASTRWGCSPSSDQIRCTVAGLTPTFAAIVRQDQWV